MSPQLIARFQAQIQSGDFAPVELPDDAAREVVLDQLASAFELAWLHAALSYAADERFAQATIDAAGRVKLNPGESIRRGEYMFRAEPDGLIQVLQCTDRNESRRRAIQELLLDRLDRG